MNFDKSAMGHGHPFVNLQDVFGKNEVSCKNLGLAFSTENQRKDYNLDEGDVLFIRSSVKPEGVGEAAVVSRSMINTTFSGFIIRFRPSIEMDVSFNRFAYSTTKCRKQILASSTSSANSNINQESLQRIRLSLPSRPEQTKIGNTFQKLDSLVNQHQQKHDKLSNLKKAMLEKMFPKQGETVPEIRFKGFSGEWKSTDLAELALFNPREDLPASFKYVDLESVKGTSLIGYRKELKENAPSRAQRLAKKGDVFFQTVRPYQKNNYLFNKDDNDFVFSTGYAQLRPYYDGDFLLNLVQRDLFVKDVLDNCTGTSYPAINASILAGLRVQYPESKEEQAAIGSYFQKLDTLIEQHQQQITKLTNIKQACLSKMFV
jgi:type I restriction enzyme S subunit